MRALTLEFIAHRRLPWAGLAVLLLSLSAGGWVAAEWIGLRQGTELARHGVAKLEAAARAQRERAVREAGSTPDPSVAQARKEEQRLAAALNYPWNRVLAGLEQPRGNEVAILSFAHDQASGASQLAVEAVNFPALIHFVDTLNEDLEGRRWYVASYQPQKQAGLTTIKASLLER